MRLPPLLRLLVALAVFLPATAHAASARIPGGLVLDPIEETPAARADAGRPLPGEGVIPYVIVADRSLAPIFQRLAQAHERDGLSARVRTVQSIRAAYPEGRDDAERIRMFLKHAYARWGTRWVLLGGDDPLVPVRRVLLRGVFGDPARLLPTDQYYACLDGTWNADGDDDWGENPDPAHGEPGDAVDFEPELNVGRAPVASRQEARLFVDKAVREMGAGEAGTPMKVLLAAADLGSEINPVDLAHYTEGLVPVFTTTPPPLFTRLYQDWEDWPGSHPLTRSSLLESLDSGHDVVVLAGAGGPRTVNGETSGVFSAGAQPDNDVFYADVQALTNRRPSHVLAASAWTTRPGARSIGAGLILAPGGAVTVIGAVDNQVVGPVLIQKCLEHVYEAHASTIGEALREAILEMTPAAPVPDLVRLTTQGNLLLGDPALPFPVEGAAPHDRRPGARAGAVQEPEIEGPSPAVAAVSPNPASIAARLEYVVTGTEAGRPLSVIVVDLAGRRVRTLARGTAEAGPWSASWDLRNDAGRRVGAGLYFARITIGDAVHVCRIAVAR